MTARGGFSQLKASLLIAFAGTLSCLVARSGLADDYVPIDPRATSEDEVTVTNLPPVADQDTTGLCYAFQQALLLEAHLCRVSGTDCQSSDQARISPLFVASLKRGMVHEITDGGDPISGLQQIKLFYENRAVRESCAPFDQLSQTEQSPTSGRLVTDEGVGWRKLARIYQGYQSHRFNPQSCARQAFDILEPKVQTSFEQVMSALDEPNEDAFRAKLLIPSGCLEARRMVRIPDYEIHTYPRDGQKPDKDEFIRIIRFEVSQGIPVAIDLCLSSAVENGATTCKSGHSTVITGIKTVCYEGRCAPALRLQNSWGEGWQEAFNGGWVNGDDLFEKAIAFGKTYGGSAIHWLTQPGEPASPPREAVTPPRVDENKTPPRRTPGGLYKCVGEDGSPIFTDRPEVCQGRPSL